MATSQELLGRISSVAGVLALLITGGFVYVNGGFMPTGPTPLMDNLDFNLNTPRIIGYFSLAIGFEFGTPLLCGIALLFGLPTRSLGSARIGIATGTVSLALYILTVRACFQLAA